MSQSPTNIYQTDAQEQVILPMAVAFRICNRGIRTRLGRSIVTVLGVALGTAFLMSVVAGVLIKTGLQEDAAAKREVERRVVLLRGQIGRLDGKKLAVVAVEPSEIEQAMVQSLVDEHAAVVQPIGTLDELKAIDTEAVAVVGLGRYGDLDWGAATTGTLGDMPTPLLAFRKPADPKAAETLKALWGSKFILLSLELRPEEVARHAKREKESLYRTLWIVGVSLLITAIGIANAMLMSVTERVREIGTMKCLGALSSFVVKLFLIESALVGFFGALLGMVVGMVFALIGYAYAYGIGRVLVTVDYAHLGLAIVGCVVTGIILAVVAGIYPARVAAKMIPASALASHV